jgi:large subunit ribosomal protein L18
MPKITQHRTLKEKRKLRVSGKMHGTAERPRVAVFRSNMHISLQAIDDVAQKTVAAASDLGKTKVAGTKTERAIAITKDLVTKLKKATISAVVFDRGAYRYHGRVKTVAETLRKEGITV